MTQLYPRPFPMFPDIPTTVDVTNQTGAPLVMNGLPTIGANATVTVSLNNMSEARRLQRWKTLKNAIAGGKLAFAAPNVLWGTLRLKNLTANLVTLGYFAPLQPNEVRDVDVTSVTISLRFRTWKAVNNATGNGVVLYEANPSVDNPTVASISPATSDLAGAITVTIRGEDFAPGATVTIGGVSATSVTFVNDSTITCTVPVGTAGAKNVVVTNSVGHTGTLTNGYTYTAASFVSISPTNADLAGAPVTITGTNFKAGATVTIGGVAATSVVVVNATTITCVAAVGTAGAKNVVVTNPGTGGSAATGAGAFTYTAATFGSITPTSGLAAGSTPITNLAGTNFKTGATVTFGGVPATSVVVVSATQITCVTPPHATGAVNVVVTNPGTGGSVATGTGAFTYT